LQAALAALEQQLGFSASAKALAPSHAAPPAAGQLYLIRVSGHDKTGITYHTATLLAERQLDIIDLQAQRFEGEEGPVYMLLVEFVLPAHQPVEDLHQALRAMSDQLGVESHLVAVDREIL
jgi:glycine cleavage system regulatory protein